MILYLYVLFLGIASNTDTLQIVINSLEFPPSKFISTSH